MAITPPPADERALAASALAGDERALGSLLSLHQQTAYNVAYRVLGSEPDARDAVQDGYLRAWRAVRGDGAPPRDIDRFAPWLRRVVANAALDQLRRRPSLRPVSVEDVAEVLPAPDQGEPARVAERREARGDVLRALLALPHTQRAALTLREYEELPYDEIAQTLGVSRSAVETLLFRARRGFRAAYEGLAATTDPIGCAELAPLISTAVDEEGGAAVDRLQVHLAGCPRCRRELDGLRRARRLYAMIPLLAVPAGWDPVAAVLEASGGAPETSQGAPSADTPPASAPPTATTPPGAGEAATAAVTTIGAGSSAVAGGGAVTGAVATGAAAATGAATASGTAATSGVVGGGLLAKLAGVAGVKLAVVVAAAGIGVATVAAPLVVNDDRGTAADREPPAVSGVQGGVPAASPAAATQLLPAVASTSGTFGAAPASAPDTEPPVAASPPDAAPPASASPTADAFVAPASPVALPIGPAEASPVGGLTATTSTAAAATPAGTTPLTPTITPVTATAATGTPGAATAATTTSATGTPVALTPSVAIPLPATRAATPPAVVPPATTPTSGASPTPNAASGR